MLRAMTVALALTTGLVWGMVGCAYGGENDAPLDIWVGQVQREPVAPAAYPAAYSAEWSPMTLPPIQVSGLALS